MEYESNTALFTLIKLRRDTAANWASANPILAQGEPGFELDTLKIKIGDGNTVWSSLDYQPSSADLSNIVSSLDGKLDLEIQTPVSQTLNAQNSVNIGVFPGGSPRVQFHDSDAETLWQIDSNNGRFRWFTPGIIQASLTGDGVFTARRGLAVDANTEPDAPSSGAVLFVDSSGSDLKVKLANGTITDLGNYTERDVNETISGDWNFTGQLNANGNPVVEETVGTWTPVLVGSTTAGTQTYMKQYGRWKRYGDLIFVDCEVKLSAYDTATYGPIRISGLPVSTQVTRSGVTFATIQTDAALPGDLQQLSGFLVNSEVRLQYMSTSGANRSFLDGFIGDGFHVRFSVVYPM